jgi:hypothetical protein
VKRRQTKRKFAICVQNDDYKCSLELRKIYVILPDAKAAKSDFVRIVDESGEDYLYHESHFAFVDFPKPIEKKILALQAA